MTEQNNELKQIAKTERKEKRQRGLKPLPDGRWQYSWTYQGKYHRKIARTKSEARAYLEKIRTEKREGRYLEVKPKLVDVTFDKAVEQYLSWSKINLSKATYGIDMLCAKSWLDFPLFRGRLLTQITVIEAEKYKEHLLNQHVKNGTKRKGKSLTPRTIDIRISRLKRLFSLCVDWGLLENNKMTRVKLLRRDDKRERYLSAEEETRLLDNASEELSPVIRFALNTGMRRGEILGLRWSDINFDSGVITIPATRSKGRKERHIPLNSMSLEVLRGMPTRSINRGALVFANSKGNIWDRLKKHWEIARKKAGLDDFRFHDLRHTFASRLVMRGVDLTSIQKLLGHQDYETTLRYAHLSPNRLKEAVSVLELPQEKFTFSCDSKNSLR